MIFLPAPETWRHNDVTIDVRTTLSFVSPWDLKQLLHYSLKKKGSWCSRCFSLQLNDFFLVSPQHLSSCFLLQFYHLICKSKSREHNLLPFTSAHPSPITHYIYNNIQRRYPMDKSSRELNFLLLGDRICGYSWMTEINRRVGNL